MEVMSCNTEDVGDIKLSLQIHPERDVKIKKLSREVFEQLFRAEYKCDYCGERGRHKPISRHHKVSHPGLPMKVSRIPQPSRENVYFR